MQQSRLFVPVGSDLWTWTHDGLPALPSPERADAALLATGRSVLREARRAGYGKVLFLLHDFSAASMRRARSVLSPLRGDAGIAFAVQGMIWDDGVSIGTLRRASARHVRDAAPMNDDRVLPMNLGTTLLPGALLRLALPDGVQVSIGHVVPAGERPAPAVPARIIRKPSALHAAAPTSRLYAASLAPALLFSDVARLHGALIRGQSFAMPDVHLGAPAPTHDWLFFSANSSYMNTLHVLESTHRAPSIAASSPDASAIIPAGAAGERLSEAPQSIAWAGFGLPFGKGARRVSSVLEPAVKSLFGGAPLAAGYDPQAIAEVQDLLRETGLAAHHAFAYGTPGFDLLDSAMSVLSWVCQVMT